MKRRVLSILVATVLLTCLWPPNHKCVDISVMGVTEPDGDPVTITITAISSDEAAATDLGSGGAKHTHRMPMALAQILPRSGLSAQGTVMAEST